MTYFEGILLSWNGELNAAAIGAEITGNKLSLRSYKPSNTADNLSEHDHFTFSLTDDPALFYKSALTGHNSPVKELERGELKEEDGFFYPKDATRTFFCRVIDRELIKETDRYGEAKILKVDAEITDEKGSEDHIGREDPTVDAMVTASRIHAANHEQKRELIERVEDLLEGVEGELARKIIDFVKEHDDEI